MTNTKHYTQDRRERENLIRQIGTGKAIANFTVDRGHRNGPEIHIITENAIIIVKNERTHKTVTKLIARPGQIRRYFTEITEEIQRVIDKAREHELKGYNLI